MAKKRAELREAIIVWKASKDSGYKTWVQGAAKSAGKPLSLWLEDAAARLAEEQGYKVPPPEREQQVDTQG